MNSITAWIILLAGFILPHEALAQYITVDADLIVRPGPDWSQTRNKIEVNPSSKLPNMHFELPYTADWTNVQASLLDGLQVRVQNIAENEALVDLQWVNPGVLIYDLVLSDGKCFGVNWRLPQGGWRVQGRIFYNPAQNSIGWQEFSFVNEAVGAPTVNLGDCNLSIARTEQLTQDLLNQTINPNWMEPMVRRAILEWTAVTKGSGTGLMEPVTLALTECVDLTWTPLELRELPNGMWRIPGRFSLTSSSHNIQFPLVQRTESENTLNNITANTLVLPINAVEMVASATARNRGFHGFVPAMEINQMRSLLTNPNLQLHEWADLLFFTPMPQFMFHVSAHGPVTLFDRKSNGKGLNWGQKSAVTVTAKPRINNQWWPYYDFKGIEDGRVALSVRDSVVGVDLSFKPLDMRSYPRDEFLQIRPIPYPHTYMDRLNVRLDKVLSQHQFGFQLPRWQVGNGETLVANGITDTSRSIRMPLAVSQQDPFPYGTVLRIVDVP